MGKFFISAYVIIFVSIIGNCVGLSDIPPPPPEVFNGHAASIPEDAEYVNYDEDVPGIENKMYWQPPDMGNKNITESKFIEVIQTMFANSKDELLCSVPSLKSLSEIPSITCSEKQKFTTKLLENLKKLQVNYEDDRAQNGILEIVWKSTVGSKMLQFLVKHLDMDKSRVISLVKELWFVNHHLFDGILFPNVFLGYEKNEGKSEKESAEKGVEDIDMTKTKVNASYPYSTAPISWTGNYLRKNEPGTKFEKGNISVLTDDSTYLADIEVTMGGFDRSTTFIIGVTFLYDFVSYTMCWIVGAKLERCLVPLPGSDTVMIDIRNMTETVGKPNPDPRIQEQDIFCVGFNLHRHDSS